MLRRVAYLTVLVGLALSMTGCALNFLSFNHRASWREQAEGACLARRQVIATNHIQRVGEVDGRGSCGIDQPWKVNALMGGTVGLTPTGTLGCPITEAFEGWIRDSVQPAAVAWFGMPVVEIHQISDYSCRPRNNIRGEKLSEHAFGNAVDVAGFKLLDGRVITVKNGWRGAPDVQAFLREIAATACATFKTFLGPGAPYHGDHFHLDLAHHNKDGTSRYCHPTPQVVPPHRPPYYTPRVANVPADPATLDSGPPVTLPGLAGPQPPGAIGGGLSYAD